MDWDTFYELVGDLAYAVRDEVRGSNRTLYFNFSDDSIAEPTTNDLDAIVRKLVMLVDKSHEAEREEGYKEGVTESKEAFDEGYALGYEAGVNNRGYDNDEAYDRSIGN